jgi:Methyltransferase domain
MEQVKQNHLNCKICGHPVHKYFNTLVLRKYPVDFMACPNCEFLFPAEVFWLNEAYQRPINLEDTSILERNIRFAKIISVILYFFFKRQGQFLDFAGGYGLFTRLMRDIGFNFQWYDPHTPNLFAQGFECELNSSRKFELITACEVLEHFENPAAETSRLFSLSDNLLFSTILLPQSPPRADEWWYYGFEHGQHISFYSKKTMEFLAQKNQRNLLSSHNIHLFTAKSISPLLYQFIVNVGFTFLFLAVKKLMSSLTTRDAETMREKPKI